ncbi:mannose-6-phosphate isomerase, class I [Nocardioides coralli]|uniref:mannose-6-phosphate isomerase, class I n=1 Tax=Nocardioides coralli TaxID=2872154 RepID=UPI001CA3B731|nr:mannose-6-phosphate isomerase, class I [Nocardioides coralli]QZY28779.1 mannose-6-phosphate isomerase, class I [Nocardioides coralli]
MYRLRNPVRHYAWGSGFHIPRALGEQPDGRPWAELWMGSHPSDPSLLDDGTRLDEVIAADPGSMLGEPVASSFGRLPFLMKLLAAGEPLSLQVHPTSEQAARGFAAEDAAGIGLDAPERCYRDASHKPELIYALTRFEGMAGFRDANRTALILRELRLDWLDTIADRLEGARDPSSALRSVVGEILGWQPEEVERTLRQLATAAEEARRRLHRPPGRRRPAYVSAESVQREALRVCEMAPSLAARYPADPGVIVTLLLNHVVLAAGEAMFLPAGNIHAYTSGFGVEIMASSDNVVRAGLTPKYVDIPELLRIADFDPTPPPRWAPAEPVRFGLELFRPPVDEFELLVAARRRDVRIGAGPSLVLALSGSVDVVEAGEASTLAAGEAAYVQSVDAQVDAAQGRVAIGRCPGGLAMG